MEAPPVDLCSGVSLELLSWWRLRLGPRSEPESEFRSSPRCRCCLGMISACIPSWRCRTTCPAARLSLWRRPNTSRASCRDRSAGSKKEVNRRESVPKEPVKVWAVLGMVSRKPNIKQSPGSEIATSQWVPTAYIQLDETANFKRSRLAALSLFEG